VNGGVQTKGVEEKEKRKGGGTFSVWILHLKGEDHETWMQGQPFLVLLRKKMKKSVRLELELLNMPYERPES